MKTQNRYGIVRGLALGAAALLLSPAALAVKGGTVSTTFTLKDEPQTFPSNVCGVDYTVTETTNVVVHVTDFLATPNPMDVFNFKEEGDVTLVPADASLPTYTGHVVARAAGESSGNEEGFTTILNLTLTGSDGSTFRPKVLQHVTLVNGVLVVEHERFACE